MFTFIRTVTMVALLAVASQAAADLYTFVDETGQIHYTDQWVEGCEKVEMPDSPSAVLRVTPVASPRSDPAPMTEPTDKQAREEPAYNSLRVVSPEEDECLRRLGGIVKVSVEVNPAPQKRKFLQEPGHRLLVTIDGKHPDSEFLIELQDGLLVLFLTEVYRGTHTLQVTIEDEDGEKLARSQVVNFHVQQISKIMLERLRRKQIQTPTSPPSR